VRIEIDKRIPIAAGMAGGSADAAAVLRLAVELAPGRPEEIAAIAASLGADVPSQLTPGLVLGTGAGDLVEPLLPVEPHGVLVLPVPFELSTADVYREADRLALPRDGDSLATLREGLERALRPGARVPPEYLVNDLEPAARSLCPLIDSSLGAALEAGADHAIVCGSGPTVAGLFWGLDGFDRARRAAGTLADRFSGAVAASPVPDGYGFPQFA
jgi:4-diphosphocytidyl-2-C-methyl-D-erythritol kinase